MWQIFVFVFLFDNVVDGPLGVPAQDRGEHLLLLCQVLHSHEQVSSFHEIHDDDYEIVLIEEDRVDAHDDHHHNHYEKGSHYLKQNFMKYFRKQKYVCTQKCGQNSK